MQRTVTYWRAASGVPANTYVPAPNQKLLGAGVVNATALAGFSSKNGKNGKNGKTGKTGSFIPTATLAGWLASGSGLVRSEGIVLSESGRPGGSQSDASLLGEP